MEGIVLSEELRPVCSGLRKKGKILHWKLKKTIKLGFQGSFILLCFLFGFKSHTGGSAEPLCVLEDGNLCKRTEEISSRL